jgi:hypothetical protein
VSPAVSRLASGLNLAAGVHLPDSGKHSSGAERPVFYQENTRARARARSLVSSKEKEKEGKGGKGRVGLAQNPARFFFLPPARPGKARKLLEGQSGCLEQFFLLVVARHRSDHVKFAFNMRVSLLKPPFWRRF